MRWETWVSLAAGLVGAALPLAWVGPSVVDHPALLPAVGVVVLPFVLVAGTGWSARLDRRAARVTAVVGLLALVVALGGWSWAARDREGVAMILVALLFVPAAQLLIWVGGAVVSGHRPRGRTRRCT